MFLYKYIFDVLNIYICAALMAITVD